MSGGSSMDDGPSLHTVSETFAEHTVPATPIGFDPAGARLAVAVIVEPFGRLPDEMPEVFPGGQLASLHWPEADRGRFYERYVRLAVRVTAERTFAVVPGLRSVTVLAVREAGGSDRNESGSFEPGAFEAVWCRSVDRSEAESPDGMPVDDGGPVFTRDPDTGDVLAMDLADQPAVAALLERYRSAGDAVGD